MKILALNMKVVDLASVLDINNKNIYKQLDEVTDLIMKRYIKVSNKDKKNKQVWKKYHLIKDCECIDGELIFRIDNDMIPFYLELQRYTKYRLKYILEFKRKYSFRIYELLKQYENIGTRFITIENFREILEVDKTKYPHYSNIKQKILDPSKKEISKYTDISFEYKEKKSGRLVTAIEFIITTQKSSSGSIDIPVSKKTLPKPKINLRPNLPNFNNFEERKYDQEYFESIYEEL